MVIRVELAGLKRENLEIAIDGNRIMISGQRPDDDDAIPSVSLIAEIPFGPFECVVTVPPEFDLTTARALYQNGILRVIIPSRPGTSRFIMPE